MRNRCKANRLINYDYSAYGAYFITICTNNKRCLFWEKSALNIINQQESFTLSEIGETVKSAIINIEKIYSNVIVDKYVVMPNHIHMIIMLMNNNDGRTLFAPTPCISRIIKQFKGIVTKQVGCAIWQKSFYDHIIRNENDYKMIWQYIDNNPLKWELDSLYISF